MSYKLLKTEDDVRIACAELSKLPAIGADTETTALHSKDGKLRLVQLSDGTNTNIIDMFDFPSERGVLTPLKTLMEDKKVIKIFHNGKFDYQWLKIGAGIEPEGIFDTILADIIVDTATIGITTYKHGLGTLAFRHLNIEVDKEEQRSDWGGALSKSQLEYAASDASILIPLRKHLMGRLERLSLQKIAKIEFDAICAFADLEINGFAVDKELYQALADELAIIQAAASKKLQDLIRGTSPNVGVQTSMFDGIAEVDHGQINLNSYIQIRKAFRALGVPIFDPKNPADKKLIDKYKRAKKPHATSTQAKYIDPLARDYPVLEVLKEYRSAEKMFANYGQPVVDMILNGRLYSEFRQIGAMTGRTANAKPNLQQIPHGKEFRQCFRAPEGRKLVDADYSQFELRILAELSQDPAMLKVFNKGLDLHIMTTSGVFGIHYDDIKKDIEQAKIEKRPSIYAQQRDFGKRLNFSVAYGISPFAYAQATGMSLEDAEKALRKFAQTYPVMDKWLNETGQRGLETLEAMTMAGRRVKFMEPKGKPDSKERRGEEGGVRRNARNTPIQGSNADILKIALPRIYKDLKPYDAKLVSEIHDEIVVEASDDCAEEAKLILEKHMRESAEIYITSLPVVVEGKICSSWDEK